MFFFVKMVAFYSHSSTTFPFKTFIKKYLRQTKNLSTHKECRSNLDGHRSTMDERMENVANNTMEHYSVIKRKGLLEHVTTRMNLEDIVLSEIKTVTHIHANTF